MRITIDADTLSNQPNVTVSNSANQSDSNIQVNEAGSSKANMDIFQSQANAAQSFDSAGATNAGAAPSF